MTPPNITVLWCRGLQGRGWKRVADREINFCPPFQHLLFERLTSRHNGGTSGAPLKPLRDDSALRALSSLRGLRGTPEVPRYAERRQSLGQQMLKQWAKIGKGVRRLKSVPGLFHDRS